jgi:hypothetical protein
MTEAEWLDETNRIHLYNFEDVLGQERRRLRLFGSACCRRVWHLVLMDAARCCVELAEEYSDGKETDVLKAAKDAPDFADLDRRLTRATESGPQLSKLTHNVIEAARYLADPNFNLTSACCVMRATSGNPDDDFFWEDGLLLSTDVPSDDRERAEQDKLLRDIFGNPFRPVAFSPEWRTSTAVAIAQGMYESRDFSAMPILADALQDAGCDNADILDHCRGPGPHVRGCWVVDLVLGKA